MVLYDVDDTETIRTFATKRDALRYAREQAYNVQSGVLRVRRIVVSRLTKDLVARLINSDGGFVEWSAEIETIAAKGR